VDAAGNLYVVDTDNHRIQRFDAAGRFVASWGEHGSFPGLLAFPSGAVIRGDRLFVADTRNHRVQVFDLQGNAIHEWGLHAPRLHVGAGTFETPVSVAVSPAGDRAVVCEAVEDRVQEFGLFPGPPPPIDPVLVSMNAGSHYGAHLDAMGDLLVISEPDAASVLAYDLDAGPIPIHITSFGSFGGRFGQFERIDGVAIGPVGAEILVSDTAAGRVQAFRLRRTPGEAVRFDPTMAAMWRAIDLNRSAFLGAEVRVQPDAVARSVHGELFILDSQRASVTMLDARGAVTRRWGEWGQEAGQLNQPTDLAVSADGLSVWIVDAGNRCVLEFSVAGDFRRALGRDADGGGFARPFGICLGHDGFLYVTDRTAHEVCKISREGAIVQRWGKRGSLDGEFWKPAGIVQDQQGRVFVLDQGNHRVQAFSPDGEWLITFDAGRARRRAETPPPQ
jgi:sugar lactone lactonase YvrE